VILNIQEEQEDRKLQKDRINQGSKYDVDDDQKTMHSYNSSVATTKH